MAVSTLNSSLVLFIYATSTISTMSFAHFFLWHLLVFPNKVCNSCENTEIKNTGNGKTKGIKNNDWKSNQRVVSNHIVYRKRNATLKNTNHTILCSTNQNENITETKMGRWSGGNENQTTVWLSFWCSLS